MELIIRSKHILVGDFYRPPNNSLEYFYLLKESIDKACSTNTVDNIITSDFNCNMKNANNKMTELILEFNLTQLISESRTHHQYLTSFSSVIEQISYLAELLAHFHQNKYTITALP